MAELPIYVGMAVLLKRQGGRVLTKEGVIGFMVTLEELQSSTAQVKGYGITLN